MKSLLKKDSLSVENQELYWYQTYSGLHPSSFVFYINFKFVGMEREATPKEIDRFRLVEIGKMTRSEFGKECEV